MAGIYLIFAYGLGLVLRGLITLAPAPPFRLTFVNLLIFVAGGVLGLVISTNPYLYASRALLGMLRAKSSSVADVLVYPVMLFGTIGGGAGLVWPKCAWERGDERYEAQTSLIKYVVRTGRDSSSAKTTSTLPLRFLGIPLRLR